ncbi:MAG: hypothetical protein JNK82_17355 [Myxococcaceae bacterium]|nr:hypothetical protein [Myxococcaceae bacterium]
MARGVRTVVLQLALAIAACKVPLNDIQAQFTLADATWFEQEQTLFFFWRLEAQQGLGELSQVEVTYRTDDVQQPWAVIQSLPQVHTHLPVDCGVNGRCGSGSLEVEKLPRDVSIRLRYHRDGQVFLNTVTAYSVVGTGEPHTNRSLLVYGVFDESNRRVQWRSRNVFPTLRNEEVTDLGLRRDFRVLSPGVGDVTVPLENPYGYGMVPGCPAGLAPLGWAEVQTNDRASFATEELPLTASTSSGVCARAIVTDATGNFEAAAVARKNPEVRPSFPTLRSPVKEALPVGFVVKPCNRVISQPHLDMQVQRLLLAGVPTACIDDPRSPGLADRLAGQFRDGIDVARAQGRDMVLVLAYHHDDTSGLTSAVLEDALEQVIPVEIAKTTPRVVGAFVLDGYAYKMTRPAVARTVLWCPARFPVGFDGGGVPVRPDAGDDLDLLPNNAQQTCPLLPDSLELMLGPFRFTQLPILPTRAQYLTFIDKYSEGQAGRTTKLTFVAPERTPTSRNVDLGEFAVATFYNSENITAAPTDAFSFCEALDAGFNNAVFGLPNVMLPPEIPAAIPISFLPQLHAQFPLGTYTLGLLWDFPFLTTLEYETAVAGAASAFSVKVPFGIGVNGSNPYGSRVWEQTELALGKFLVQCTRFCDHPTFDSGGVYNVLSPFRTTYASSCYVPKYQVPPGERFPLDP